MGWTYTYRRPGVSNNEFFGKMWIGSTAELLDTAQIGFTVYGALRLADGRVRALVILTRWVKDYYNFGYKDMDESMGPCDVACPERIFALLTPLDETDSKWAHEWRDKVRVYHETNRSRPRLTKGTKVRFEQALTFTDGSEADTFEFIKRSTFRTIVPLDFAPQVGEPWYYGGLVRIRGWANMPYTVLT